MSLAMTSHALESGYDIALLLFKLCCVKEVRKKMENPKKSTKMKMRMMLFLMIMMKEKMEKLRVMKMVRRMRRRMMMKLNLRFSALLLGEGGC
ncbi:hypothetical protein X975_09361, partial [Stegodyphus mimosarum]